MSASGSHEKGPAVIVHLCSNTHLRADISVTWFGDYLREMPIRQIPMMCPETAIARSSRC